MKQCSVKTVILLDTGPIIALLCLVQSLTHSLTEKLHHSRQTVNSMLKSCKAECLFDICQSDISNVETRWFVIYMLSTHLQPLLCKVARQLLKDECTSQGPKYAMQGTLPSHLFYFKSIFFYYTFFGQGCKGAFEVVHSALSSVGINCILAAAVVVVVVVCSRHAGTVCQKEYPPFCTSILRLIRSPQSFYFKLASFQARIFSNITNSLIPQLSLSVQIVTDGAGNQD